MIILLFILYIIIKLRNPNNMMEISKQLIINRTLKKIIHMYRFHRQMYASYVGGF